MPSLRGGPLCLAWEEALFSEPERRTSVSSMKGDPLYLAWEEALFSEPERRPFLL